MVIGLPCLGLASAWFSAAWPGLALPRLGLILSSSSVGLGPVKTASVSSLLGSGRNITVDNIFTDLKLAEDLLSSKTTLVGTMRKSEGDIPLEMMPYRQREEKSSINQLNTSLIRRRRKRAHHWFSTIHSDGYAWCVALVATQLENCISEVYIYIYIYNVVKLFIYCQDTFDVSTSIVNNLYVFYAESSRANKLLSHSVSLITPRTPSAVCLVSTFKLITWVPLILLRLLQMQPPDQNLIQFTSVSARRRLYRRSVTD